MNTIKAFVVILFIATTLAANAQERYERMVIVYFPTTRTISISSDTGEYKEETIPKSELKGAADVTPPLIRIKTLSEEGWELYQNSMDQYYFVFHLRRVLK